MDICQISGVPGLSYGVSHHGETIHRANFGFRDVDANLAPTSDTIYGIGSMSKAFTAAAIGILVEDGRLSWNTLVRDVLPAFNSSVSQMNEQLTVLDLLSHRSGLAGPNDIWTGSNSVPLLDKSQTVPTFNSFGAVNPFRGQFHYNNWGYAMAGEVIEALSAQSWGTFLEQKLIKPLKMDRSFTTRSAFKNENDVAKPYGALDNASVFPLAEIQMEDGTIMAPAGAVRSTVNDMLKWSAALLSAYKDRLASGQGSTTGSPLKQVPIQLTGHIPMMAPYYLERTYGMVGYEQNCQALWERLAVTGYRERNANSWRRRSGITCDIPSRKHGWIHLFNISPAWKQQCRCCPDKFYSTQRSGRLGRRTSPGNPTGQPKSSRL